RLRPLSSDIDYLRTALHRIGQGQVGRLHDDVDSLLRAEHDRSVRWSVETLGEPADAPRHDACEPERAELQRRVVQRRRRHRAAEREPFVSVLLQILRSRDEGGFTLVELLIALVVLSVGILALIAAYSSGYVTLNRAPRVSSARLVADQQMERYRAVQYS